ncbi:MAG TPA: hypothetical protein VI251_06595 [Pseudolabrys sp.]
MTEKYITAATIDGLQPTLRALLAVCFWLWGGFGLLLNVMYFLGLSGSISVGPSAYLAACLLLWIGGMVMFGLGALIAPNNYEFKRPSE